MMRPVSIHPWSLAVAGAYALAAFALGSAYPFFPFDMFSFQVEEGQQVAGPLLVERPDGTTHRVQAFDGWRCGLPADTLARATCTWDTHVDFRWRRMDHRHLVATASDADGGETVRLIRRIHAAYEAGDQAGERCMLTACRADFSGDAGGFYGR